MSPRKAKPREPVCRSKIPRDVWRAHTAWCGSYESAMSILVALSRYRDDEDSEKYIHERKSETDIGFTAQSLAATVALAVERRILPSIGFPSTNTL